MAQEVIIVDDQGQEHIFPEGFDPKRAADIVRNAGKAATPPPAASQMQEPKSVTGFLQNMKKDAGDVLAGFNPLRWPGALAAGAQAKQQAEQAMVDEFKAMTPQQRQASVQPKLSNLTREVGEAADTAYQQPVSTAMALGSVMPKTQAAVVKGVKAGATKVGEVVGDTAVKLAENPAVGALAGGYTGYHTGGVPGAAIGAVTGALGARGVAGIHHSGGMLGVMQALRNLGNKVEDTAATATRVPRTSGSKMGDVLKDFPAETPQIQPTPFTMPVPRGAQTPSGPGPNIVKGMGDAGAREFADIVAKRQMGNMNPPSPNAGGFLRQAPQSLEQILEEARQLQPEMPKPRANTLPPQANPVPVDSAVEATARQLAQGTKTPDQVRFDAKVFESEFPKPTPPPRPISKVIQGMSEAGRAAVPEEITPAATPAVVPPEVAAPTAPVPGTVLKDLLKTLQPTSSKSKGVKLSVNDMKFIVENNLVEAYAAGEPAAIQAVEAARQARHATNYQNAQADAAYRRQKD